MPSRNRVLLNTFLACGHLMLLFCLHKLWQFIRHGADRVLRPESLEQA